MSPRNHQSHVLKSTVTVAPAITVTNSICSPDRQSAIIFTVTVGTSPMLYFPPLFIVSELLGGSVLTKIHGLSRCPRFRWPESYWDITGQQNPRKEAAPARRNPRRRKTASGMRQDGAKSVDFDKA